MAARPGRPRNPRVDEAIVDAARRLLVREGYTGLYLEHVAAEAGVAKSTVYRRYGSKEELAEALLEALVPWISEVPDTGDTREDLIETVMGSIRGITSTPYGPVVSALLSEIVLNPRLGDAFRTRVVRSRREHIAELIDRCVARGDLATSTDAQLATELLLGPVYFRLIFGGTLDRALAEQVVDGFVAGHAAERS